MSFKNSFLNLVNKHFAVFVSAIIVTAIGVGLLSMQAFSPDDYKPSNWFSEAGKNVEDKENKSSSSQEKNDGKTSPKKLVSAELTAYKKNQIEFSDDESLQEEYKKTVLSDYFNMEDYISLNSSYDGDAVITFEPFYPHESMNNKQGDLLSALIVGMQEYSYHTDYHDIREFLNLKIYTPEYISNLDKKIVKAAKSVNSTGIYARAVINLDENLDVVIGYLLRGSKPEIDKNLSFVLVKGDMVEFLGEVSLYNEYDDYSSVANACEYYYDGTEMSIICLDEYIDGCDYYDDEKSYNYEACKQTAVDKFALKIQTYNLNTLKKEVEILNLKDVEDLFSDKRSKVIEYNNYYIGVFTEDYSYGYKSLSVIPNTVGTDFKSYVDTQNIKQALDRVFSPDAIIYDILKDDIGVDVIGGDKINISDLEIFSDGYIKDKNSVYNIRGIYNYYDSKYIEDVFGYYGVDVDSFIYLGGEYAKDKDFVYYLADARKDSINYLDTLNVDMESFEFIGNSDYPFAKDKNNIYYYGKVLENVDVDSFAYLGDDFAKDKDNAYIINSYGKLEIISKADPNSFEYVGDYYAKDKNNIYHYNSYESEGSLDVLSDIDIATFKSLGCSYSKDKESVYYYDYDDEYLNIELKYAEDVDVSTALVVNDCVLIDKNQAHYNRFLHYVGQE